ncbi:hypothetical protein SASPL_119153 [Salvia splendens]|uniref:Glycosyl transferase CAP10 domain-containing protein n=1 Tax=Salvia splendens TaxID=180675 RepID=A0A8X8XZ38_SALSN|nr:hypothetical protein SASPL_119153 [Salvia splendens]
MKAIRWSLERSSLVALFVTTLGVFICTRFFYISLMDTKCQVFTPEACSGSTRNLETGPEAMYIPLNCSMGELSGTCPANYYLSQVSAEAPSSCPDYFSWIYEDLSPWRETGITREMVMKARRTANFRLVVVDGKAYVERYSKSFQSRDSFTLWGILQLLRRYPAKLPDLDLMFDCGTLPVIMKDTFRASNYPAPPPVFAYCGNDSTMDILFPDWSFWGWPEIRIKPWQLLSKELKEGNTRTRWTDREPYAYWKGNPNVAATRMDLLKCNVSDKQDWNARVYAQNWGLELKNGYKQSDLASQCIHRFKIYIEGVAWSASQKYIMACDSVTLLVKPIFHEFFTRSLMPLKHYWPIKDEDKCRSIKHAAQAVGKAASSFILDDLKMDYIYDYMFHLLSEYAKLLKYKPTVPEKASELCSELLACRAKGLEKKFMVDSLVGPASTQPCTMPPPYSPAYLHSVIERKDNGMKQVDTWEREYWKKS